MSDFKDSLTEFKETISLENTRRQYDIIELLATEYGKHMHVSENSRDIVYRADNLYDSILNFIKIETAGLNDDKIGDSNPLHKYIRSRNKDELFNIGINEDKSINHHKITSLITYFSLVRYYESIIDNMHIGHNANAIDRSDFDRITESIRCALDVDVCHIISLKDGDSIILSSSNERYYPFDDIDNNKVLFAFSQLMTTGIDPIPDKKRNENLRTINDVIHVKSDVDTSTKKALWLIDNTIGLRCVQYDDDKAMEVLIIRISPDNSENEIYLVALINGNIEKVDFVKSKLLARVVNVVFLKSKLWRLVDHCYESLYSSQMRFDYIPHISMETSCVMYHISDLHVSPLSFTNQLEVLTSIQDRQSRWPDSVPDLLLITGDICNGALTAYEIESNYDFAAKIIKHFVSMFWCIEEKRDSGSRQYLRSDWKKRIVFCPGNHDYAIMNELKATSKHRETTGGESIDVSGGPAAKFTYYVNALRKHFDIIDAHIDDKLNFVRSYTKIGAVIVSLNSCSEANSNLQNKAHVDFDQAINMERKMNALKQSKKMTKNPALIVMSHHSYEYFPNYFSDRYPFPYYAQDKTILDVINEFNIKENIDDKTAGKLNEFVGKKQVEKQNERDEQKDVYCKLVVLLLAIIFKLRFSELSMEEFRKIAFERFAKAYAVRDGEGSVCNIEKYYSQEIDVLIQEVKKILSSKYGTKKGFLELSGLFNEIMSDRFYINEGVTGKKANEEDSRILLRINRICSDIEESVADYRALNEVGDLFVGKHNIHWLSGHVHENAKTNEDGNVHEADKFIDGNGSLNYYKLVYNFNNPKGTYEHIAMSI